MWLYIIYQKQHWKAKGDHRDKIPALHSHTVLCTALKLLHSHFTCACQIPRPIQNVWILYLKNSSSIFCDDLNGKRLGKGHVRIHTAEPLCCAPEVITLLIHYGGGGLAAQSCPTLAIPWTVAHQAPLSTGFSRQECWSGFPFPSPGDLPDPGIKPGLLLCRQPLYGLYRLSHREAQGCLD